MPDVLLPRHLISARETGLICSDPNIILRDSLNRQPVMLQANMPYMVSDQVRPGDLDVLSILSATNASADLSRMTEEFGSNGVQVLASLQDSLTATFSSGASVYGQRMVQLKSHVEAYERALLAHRAISLAGSPLQISRSADEVRVSFNKLQAVFQNEIRAITSDVKSRRGLVLTNHQRGLNIARNSRHSSKLYVQNQTNAHQLVRLTKHTKVFNNGIAVIDFSSRVGHIKNAHAAGDDWYREMFIQSSSFAVSSISATVVSKVGVAGLGVLMMLTPVGPVALVLAGVAIAASAAATGIAANHIVMNDAGGVYDKVMETLR